MLWVVRNRRSDIIGFVNEVNLFLLWVVRNRRSDIMSSTSSTRRPSLWVVRNRRSDIILGILGLMAIRYGLYGIVDLI